MNAETTLTKIADLFKKHRLEAVMIGNAAAALQGSPVTTIDFDFMFRDSALNMNKLQAIKEELGGTLSQPFIMSNVWRLDAGDISIDFLTTVDGVKSYPGLRKRASLVSFDSGDLLVSSLEDIIASKEACNRDKDLAILPILRETLIEKRRQDKQKVNKHEKKSTKHKL